MIEHQAIEPPPAFRLLRAETEDGPAVSFQVVYDLASDSYRTVEVTIGSMFQRLGAGDVKSVRLGEAKRLMLREALLEADPQGVSSDAAAKAFLAGRTGRRPAAAKVLRPDAALLERVLVVERLARLTGDFPVRSVQRAFGLEYDEAKAIVKAARKRRKEAQ